MKAAFRRLLVKLSGEQLAGDGGFGISPAVIKHMAGELREVSELGVQLGVVIGGGNVIRGIKASAEGMDRTSADYMGMLASVINGLALQDALEKEGLVTRVLSALEIRAVAEAYIRRRAERHLEKGRVVIFGAGTGNPYFSTDTAAALRAAEIGSDIILKATKVDGVYDKDPALHDDAVRFQQLTYLDVLSRGLKVMDSTAISMCMENGLPIMVLDLNVRGNVARAAKGEAVGTLVTHEVA